MIKQHSDDPDVAVAADQAFDIVKDTLSALPEPTSFDYGGHQLKIGEYDVCTTCTRPIAEAQQASAALLSKAHEMSDPLIKEHLELAAHLFHLEAESAIVRAEFHNGNGTEKIVNLILGFLYDRAIHDDFNHSHRQGK